jgi:hypothetical protein
MNDKKTDYVRSEIHWIIKIVLIALAWIGFYNFFELLIKRYIKCHTNNEFTTKLKIYLFIGIAAALLLYSFGHIYLLTPDP